MNLIYLTILHTLWIYYFIIIINFQNLHLFKVQKFLNLKLNLAFFQNIIFASFTN